MSISLDSIRDYLRQPLVARLGTIGDNGVPHVVPLWYRVEEDRDEIIIMSDRDTRKVKNALGNAHGAVQIGGDPTPDGGGNSYTSAYLFQGEIVVEEDPGHTTTARIVHGYLQGEAADSLLDSWKDDDVVVLRLKIDKITQVM